MYGCGYGLVLLCRQFADLVEFALVDECHDSVFTGVSLWDRRSSAPGIGHGGTVELILLVKSEAGVGRALAYFGQFRRWKKL